MDGQATARIPRPFLEMPDPRAANRRHKLIDIVTIALFAVLCGADGWVAVAAYGRASASEFIAKFLMRMLSIHGVEARYIEPGSPWQNGLNERFNGTLRDECLNLETFHNRDHARALVKPYARWYTERRPHMGIAQGWRKEGHGAG